MNKFCVFLFTSLLIVVLASCAFDGEANADETPTQLFPEFQNFPEQLYYDLTFGLDENQLESFFSSHNFILQESAGARYYWCLADSAEFIVPENLELNNFKIIFRSKKYLNHTSELIDLFKSKSAESAIDKEFSIFTIEQGDVKFKLTLFSQNQFIRLSFTNKRSI